MDGSTGALANARVHNLLLGDRRAAGPAEAVGELLAIQAQEHAFSRWSVAQRTQQPSSDAVMDAVASGAIVRTHVLRPTWHYVLGEDLRWLQALTGGRVRRASAGWYRNHGLDDRVFGRARDVVEPELQGGRAMTRDALRSRLEEAGVDVSGQRMTAVMFDLELAAVVCSGPLQGTHHTYALVEERLPPTPEMSDDEATSELVRRYLAGHGPATLKDLRWWSTLTLAQLRRGVDVLGDLVQSATVGDLEYLWLAEGLETNPARAAQQPSGEAPPFQLLQVFDELFVGYAQTRGLVDPDGEYGAVLPIGFSKMMHVVLEGDRLAGRWRSDRRKGDMTVTVAPDRPLGADDVAALESAAAAYGEFVGLPVRLALRRDSTR